MAIAGDPPFRGGDSEPVPTMCEHVMGAVDATHSEARTHEGESCPPRPPKQNWIGVDRIVYPSLLLNVLMNFIFVAGGDPSSSASRSAGHDDDVVMLEAVDEESDGADSDENEGDAVYGLGNDVNDPDDVGYVRPEDELFASDDGDDLVDEGDSEDEGARPQRAARRVVEAERDE